MEEEYESRWANRLAALVHNALSNFTRGTACEYLRADKGEGAVASSKEESRSVAIKYVCRAAPDVLGCIDEEFALGVRLWKAATVLMIREMCEDYDFDVPDFVAEWAADVGEDFVEEYAKDTRRRDEAQERKAKEFMEMLKKMGGTVINMGEMMRKPDENKKEEKRQPFIA